MYLVGSSQNVPESGQIRSLTRAWPLESGKRNVKVERGMWWLGGEGYGRKAGGAQAFRLFLATATGFFLFSTSGMDVSVPCMAGLGLG